MNLKNSIKTLFLFLLSILFSTGYAQVTMTIYNMSSVTLDSVVINLVKPIIISPIEKGGKKTFFISVHQANFHSFVPFDITYHSSVLNTKLQWQKNGVCRYSLFF